MPILILMFQDGHYSFIHSTSIGKNRFLLICIQCQQHTYFTKKKSYRAEHDNRRRIRDQY